MGGLTDDGLGRQLALADAANTPFAPLSDWLSEPVGLGSWRNAAERLADTRARAPVEAVRAALDEVRRAAAVDTGAIEGLYATDRGFTMSVARNVISLDQAEVERGPIFVGTSRPSGRGSRWPTSWRPEMRWSPRPLCASCTG